MPIYFIERFFSEFFHRYLKAVLIYVTMVFLSIVWIDMIRRPPMCADAQIELTPIAEPLDIENQIGEEEHDSLLSVETKSSEVFVPVAQELVENRISSNWCDDASDCIGCITCSFCIMAVPAFVVYLLALAIINDLAKEKAEAIKNKKHDLAVNCYDLELTNLTEEPLAFLRPRGGKYCSINPWRNIDVNASTLIIKKEYVSYAPDSKCVFFTSTGIQLKIDVDGYDDDALKHDRVTAKGNDEQNCWISVKKLSDCSWGLFKKCPVPQQTIASEYHLLPKP